jgi:hypothetical protein
MSAVDTRNQYAKQDPTKQYPQPKFEEQTQSAQGLAQEMTPKPDHVPSTPPEPSSRSRLAGTNNKLPNPSEALYNGDQVFDRVVTKMPDASVARRRKALLGIDAEIPDREDPLHWLLLQQS